MARKCDECGKSVGDSPLVYLAHKVQFDFGSRECEQKYAKRHNSRPHGSYCDYCMDTLDEQVACDPTLTIRFGKYTVDFCCPRHRTEWFSIHKPQPAVTKNIVNFRLSVHLTSSDTYEVCTDLDEGDLVEGCDAFDLIELGDAADLCTGGVPVFTMIRLLSS